MRVCDRCQCYLGDGDEGSIKVKSRTTTLLGITSDYMTIDYELCDRCTEQVHNKIDAFINHREEVQDDDDN